MKEIFAFTKEIDNDTDEIKYRDRSSGDILSAQEFETFKRNHLREIIFIKGERI